MNAETAPPPASTADSPAATAPSTADSPLHLDVLVIGWGKGGKTLAATLGGQGTRVGMVEQFEDMHGGTCINIGCVPTKLLAHDASERRADDSPQQFWADAVTRRDTVVGKMREVNHATLADLDAVTLISGRARFTGDRTVEVTAGADRMTLTEDVIVIGTGAVPVTPLIPGADSPHVHDSTSLQHVDPLPQRLVIVGAGTIGIEFASMFAGYGSQVTLIGRRPRLLPGEDEDVPAAVTEILTGDGVEFLHSTEVEAIEEGAQQAAVRVRVRVDGEPREIPADAVLLATGRRPATADLGLAEAGILTDEHGAIVVDDHLRTSVDGVFATGDVHGGAQHTYLSLDDHRIVLDQLRGDGARSAADRVAIPATTFMTPPLATVGLTETAARDRGYEVLVAAQQIAVIKAMPRPKIVGDPRGLVKFVVDARTDLILGARLLHVDAQEVINLIALAMRTGTTATALRDGIWTHPSSAESLNETLGKLAPPQG